MDNGTLNYKKISIIFGVIIVSMVAYFLYDIGIIGSKQVNKVVINRTTEEANSDFLNDKNKGTIEFDKGNYTCKAGDTINAVISANIVGSNVVPTVSSYSSSNNSIVNIQDDEDNDIQCVNCKTIIINCLKEGSSTLTSISSTGAKTSVLVKVEKSNNKNTQEKNFKFNKDSYSCTPGNTINTKIDKTSSDESIITLSSDDASIATVEKDTENKNCNNCDNIKINCIKEGKITLSAMSNKGKKSTAKVEVKKKDIGTIKYDQSDYVCEAGKEINAVITANVNSSNTVSTVSKFASSDKSVATVEENKDYSVRCINCKAVKIKCIKEGLITLSAESSLGAKGYSSLEVTKPNVGSIEFNKNSYSCEEGKTIDAEITAKSSNNDVATITKYESSDTSIALIEKNPDYSVRCINCVAVRITCKKAGSVKISAESSTGAKGHTTLEVKKKDIGMISFDKTSYECKEGKTIDTEIKTNMIGDTVSTVSKYTSSNTSIATIEKNPDYTIKCINCVAVRITCKKAGNITLNAESSTGAKTSVPLKVSKQDTGTISFAKTSYECKEGKTIDTEITAVGVENSVSTVSKYTSSNTSIATIEKNPDYTPRCINCVAVRITCKKAGNITLNAESSTGAKTSVPLTVSKQNKGTIEFNEKSYSCEEGKYFDTDIAVYSDTGATVESYSSSNTNVAIIEKNPNYSVGCTNCITVRVTCKKAGKVTLRAKASTGAETSVPLTVNEKFGLYYDPGYDFERNEALVLFKNSVTESQIKSFLNSRSEVNNYETLPLNKQAYRLFLNKSFASIGEITTYCNEIEKNSLVEFCEPNYIVNSN